MWCGSTKELVRKGVFFLADQNQEDLLFSSFETLSIVFHLVSHINMFYLLKIVTEWKKVILAKLFFFPLSNQFFSHKYSRKNYLDQT